MPESWQDDPDAFAEVVRAHGPAVFGLLVARVRDRDVAQDLAQETFLRAWRGRHGFRGESSVRGWLCVIATNVVRDRARRATRRPDEVLSAELPELAAGDEPLGMLEAAEAGERLRIALAALPERHREIFLLRERDGLTYAEIAKVVGCPVGSVMSGLSRARERLLRAVQP